MNLDARYFPKYDTQGAYHWAEIDRWSSQFNPPLVARYGAVTSRIRHAKRILDVGAGDGCLTGLISAGGHTVTGIEFEASGVALARKMLWGRDRCTLVRGSAYYLPFLRHTFDVIAFSEVIEHLDDPEIALREITRVLTPDGMVIVTTPRRQQDRPIARDHVREYEPDEFWEALQPFFQDVRLTHIWPAIWGRVYRTRIGWRALKHYARWFNNPFTQEVADPMQGTQMIAVCRGPVKL